MRIDICGNTATLLNHAAKHIKCVSVSLFIAHRGTLSKDKVLSLQFNGHSDNLDTQSNDIESVL